MRLIYKLMNYLGFLATTVFLLILIDGSDVYSQNKRNIVFEEFSEVWCGPCASLSPMLKVWLENHPDYIPIHYYSYFSVNGQEKQYDVAGYNSRKSYYNVPFYPYARINAELAPNTAYQGYPTDTTKINQIIDTITKTSPVKIDIDLQNYGAKGFVNVSISSDIDIPESQLFVMIVEKHHTYAKQANGMTDFHHIMRQVIQSSGNNISLKKDGYFETMLIYSISEDLNYDLYAVAILQDINTKYIYQAESVFKPAPVSIKDIETESKINIYPNPVSSEFTIKPNSLNNNITAIEVFDVLGNLQISYENININSALTIETVDINGNNLSDGVYFVKTYTDNQVFVNKMIITR